MKRVIGFLISFLVIFLSMAGSSFAEDKRYTNEADFKIEVIDGGIEILTVWDKFGNELKLISEFSKDGYAVGVYRTGELLLYTVIKKDFLEKKENLGEGWEYVTQVDHSRGTVIRFKLKNGKVDGVPEETTIEKNTPFPFPFSYVDFSFVSAPSHESFEIIEKRKGYRNKILISGIKNYHDTSKQPIKEIYMISGEMLSIYSFFKGGELSEYFRTFTKDGFFEERRKIGLDGKMSVEYEQIK